MADSTSESVYDKLAVDFDREDGPGVGDDEVKKKLSGPIETSSSAVGQSQSKKNKKKNKKQKKNKTDAASYSTISVPKGAYSTKTEETTTAKDEAKGIEAGSSDDGKNKDKEADSAPEEEATTRPQKGGKKNKKKGASSSASLSASSKAAKSNYFEQIDDNRWRVNKGFVENMRTDAIFYANEALAEVILEEIHDSTSSGFIPAVKQLANVAGLPGIVGSSLGMPDMHSGYGFAIGNVAAIDMNDPNGVVSPGGVGFDINCGVRVLRTNLTEADVSGVKQKLAQTLYNHVPVGVGSRGSFSVSVNELNQVLDEGMEYLVKKDLIWPEDIEHCEEGGRLKNADHSKVSNRAKARGKEQTGTLGSGNHYLEVQVVDEVFDEKAANVMGLKKGNVCVMIHSGSRGLGHQVCTDYLQAMGNSKHRVMVNDRQLTGVRISSPDGQDYLAGMAAAANYAFVNRSLMMMQARKAFEEVFGKTARQMDMHMIYDVAHNIAKIEKHNVNGEEKTLLVHRKGATRAFAPHHPEIPKAYQEVGQPVLIGGSMGTFSYILTGTQTAMQETFGSTCHGAGRALSRSASIRSLDSKTVLKDLANKGIAIKVASPKLVAEEAPESYKNINDVVDTCHNAGISKKCVKLRPIAVIKG